MLPFSQSCAAADAALNASLEKIHRGSEINCLRANGEPNWKVLTFYIELLRHLLQYAIAQKVLIGLGAEQLCGNISLALYMDSVDARYSPSTWKIYSNESKRLSTEARSSLVKKLATALFNICELTSCLRHVHGVLNTPNMSEEGLAEALAAARKTIESAATQIIDSASSFVGMAALPQLSRVGYFLPPGVQPSSDDESAVEAAQASLFEWFGNFMAGSLLHDVKMGSLV